MGKFTNTVLALALLVVTSTIVNAQRITVTWAGTGASSFNGDFKAGNLTNLSSPNDVCMDAAHNIYIAESDRVRKVSASTGVVTVLAGGGLSMADGIPALNSMVRPNYICIDAAGNLYVSTIDNTVRKIDVATGIITTIAGNGTAGYTGDGIPGTAAELNTPQGICVDPAGNVYVVDQLNFRIRKIAAATGIITTVCGTGTSGDSGDGFAAVTATIGTAYAICMNAGGDIYFSDQSGEYIRMISASTGLCSKIAGNGGLGTGDGGPALLAGIGNIWGMCCDGGGNLYINDWSCSCRKIDMSTTIINTVAGDLWADGWNGDGGNSLLDYLDFPVGVCVDAAGSIYIADNENYRIRKAIQLTHTPSFAFGRGQSIYPCSGIGFTFSDRMAITDLDSAQTETWTVISAPASGALSGFPYTTASTGTGSLTTPAGLSYTSAGGYTGNDSFKIMVTDGGLSDTVTVYVVINPGGGSITGYNKLCIGATLTLSGDTATGVWSASNGSAGISSSTWGAYATTITGLATGIDTIMYTSTNACGAGTVTKTVSVNLLPDPGTLSGASSVCTGSSITLMPTVPGGTWSISSGVATVSGAGLITGVSPGTATITYSVDNECPTGGAAFTTMDVTINTLPDAGIISGTPFMMVGSSILLSNTVPGGTWSTSDNTISTITAAGMAFGISPGIDSAIYTVTNTCGSTNAYYSFAVMPGNSTANVSNTQAGNDKMAVFPNPARNHFTISISSTVDEAVTIIVTNVAGEKVQAFTGFTNKPIDAELNVPAGIYFLNASGAHGNRSSKIVME